MMVQVDDEEELKRAAIDNISKSQRTFKYPMQETDDENGKVRSLLCQCGQSTLHILCKCISGQPMVGQEHVCKLRANLSNLKWLMGC